MSSPPADPEVPATTQPEEDDPMAGIVAEDEGEGDDVMAGPEGGASDDSSEEAEEDSDAERRVREGFIVDEEDEDEDGDEDDEAERRRRRKRRRRHRREREEAADLEDDDLELLEENAGGASSGRLTRLRRGSSPGERRKARTARISDDDDEDDLELPQVQDLQRIWDDERGGPRGGDEEEADLDDMDDFIEDEDEDEDQQQMNDQERRQKRREAKQKMRAEFRRIAIPGIDANAWDEIHEVFGDGHEYDWALEGDDAMHDDNTAKPELKYQDVGDKVFEPSEIAARFLTEDDDLIRAQDIPERMQLATSSLAQTTSLSIHQALSENELDEAAAWILPRLGPQKEDDFFRANGRFFHLLRDLVTAITSALRFLFIGQLEVPHIWVHKRDHLSYFNEKDMRVTVELLSLQDLWRVYTVGQRYRALLDRRTALDALHNRFGVSDDYYENEIRKKIETVEGVSDATEWLNMKYKSSKQDFFGSALQTDGALEDRKHKLPSRISAYEVARRSIVSKLADAYGIPTHEVVLNYVADSKLHFIDDNELSPEALADQYIDPDGNSQTAETTLARARMILATELGKDPLLRQEVRALFKNQALVSCVPTERGIVKINEFSPWFNFKYLHQKPISKVVEGPQFLQILAAEADHCLTVTIALSPDAKSSFERRLVNAFTSDGYGNTANDWNEERARVVREAIEQHLLPMGAKYARDWLREETEDQIALNCGEILRKRITVGPYVGANSQPGETPSVLAVSWGRGDYQKDDITIVFLDFEGRMREHTRIDNLTDQENQDEFYDLLVRRRPDVIVVGGFSMTTTRLAKDLQTFITGTAAPDSGRESQEHIKVIYNYDEVARLYQHSKRADLEFGGLPELTKYCIGLARYTQSPLNEYAALGQDITAIAFDDRYQHLIHKDRLLTALERTLVDVVNSVGVDINRTVIDSYYRHLLPFVCGLGPRKSLALTQSIGSMGGTLVNRDQFIRSSLLTTTLFLNAAAFLHINYDADTKKSSKYRQNDEADVADPLDNTRIHPEDYELARKMATDALELDEEDVLDEHPSHVISLLMQAHDKNAKLDELNLDDFAVNMFEANGDRKRKILSLIKDELINPFADPRTPKKDNEPGAWDVLTMLSGQTEQTLRPGFIVDCVVNRISKNQAYIRLDSGIEGTVDAAFASDNPNATLDDALVKGKAYAAVIIEIKLDLPRNHLSVEVSTRPADVKPGSDSNLRRVQPDDHWNRQLYDRDVELQARKKRAEVGQQRRIIKHPNFHAFSSVHAENYLASQSRGDVVIRPSSKGADHLAVTWKVDDKLYQHIDVLEPNADPSGQTLGSRFIVEGRYEFSDLDELIVNHVQAMARRVEELMAHEKYKHGEDELHHWLRQYVKAHPNKSIYGFMLNRKRPGHFSLCFLANVSSAIQTWPIRVTPEAYYLFETPAAGVSELCDAFKVRHLHESQNLANTAAGGKTPYGGRTPGRTPAGGATPGRMSVRQPAGRTPNPYGATPATSGGGWAPIPPVPPFGGPPASLPTPAQGFQTPAYTAPVPAGMNPERARMLQRNGGGW